MPALTYRIPFLLAAAVCIQKTTTRPQPPAAKEERVAPKNAVERLVMLAISWPIFNMINAVKAGAWLPALTESAVILAQENFLPVDWSTLVLRHLGQAASHTPVNRGISQMILVGSALAVAGATLRVSAFRALGRHFTYELSLKKDHTLITSFPYNIVRHPSYLGGYATVAGVGLVLASSDGWLRTTFLPWVTSGPMSATKIGIAAFAASIAGSYLLFAILIAGRASVEDAMLRERFGQKWNDWAKRVPYQVIPYVI